MSVGTVIGADGLSEETVPGVGLRDDLCLAAVGLFFARSFSILSLIPSSRFDCLLRSSVWSSCLGVGLLA